MTNLSTVSEVVERFERLVRHLLAYVLLALDVAGLSCTAFVMCEHSIQLEYGGILAAYGIKQAQITAEIAMLELADVEAQR